MATSGLLKLPYRKFIVALAVGRSFRYFGEGFLTVRYGQQVWEWMIRSGPIVILIVLATTGVLFLTKKLRSKAPVAEG